ncbi:MAG: hypothetical protein ACXVI6_02875 [Candidatus Aminicenantales bacterium]
MRLKIALVVSTALLAFACAKGNVEIRRDAAPQPLSNDEFSKLTADFRYAPAWWQSAICLPDDWQKTLVSKEGALLYEYDGGYPGNFRTRVSISCANAAGVTTEQSTADPRVPVVETVLLDKESDELLRWSALAVVPGNDQDLPAASSEPGGTVAPRGDLLLIRKTGQAGTIAITLESSHPITFKKGVNGVYLEGRRFISVSSGWQTSKADKNRLTLVFPNGLEQLAVYCASGHEPGDVKLDWARLQPRRSAAFWARQDFPYNTVRVPDRTMQEILHSCVRNIYQAREIKNGLPIFQVGPTCYRGLWIVDGCFILEAMTYLGRGLEARAGIEHILTRQGPDGSFDILGKYWKENGIVLYILYRHALLTGDMEWLKGKWGTVKTLVGVVQRLRAESRKNPAAPEAGLMPPGFPDGGIGGAAAEYTNVYWNLAGLRAAIEAARLLRAPELPAWEAEYKDFWDTFQRAAKRDAKPYRDGLTILPILMVPNPDILPVRGQWAFCHAVFPGKIFDSADPLARGNMALLDDNQSEGLVYGTGWMADGIWNYFGSFYGHAHLWLGDGPKAAEILYAFANHASPLGAWREEQPPLGQDKKGGRFVGDMPHNWASAEFIRLVRNLLVLERGRELHVLEGLPRTWLFAKAETVLNDVATDFGPVSFRLKVSADGRTAAFEITPPESPSLQKVVVHLGAWAGDGKVATSRTGRTMRFKIPLVK